MSNKTLVATNTEASSKPKRYSASCTLAHVLFNNVYKFDAQIQSDTDSFNVGYTISNTQLAFSTDNLAAYDRMVSGNNLTNAFENGVLVLMWTGLLLYAMRTNNIDKLQSWLPEITDLINSDINAQDFWNEIRTTMYESADVTPSSFEWSSDVNVVEGYEKILNITYPQGELNFGFEADFNPEDILNVSEV